MQGMTQISQVGPGLIQHFLQVGSATQPLRTAAHTGLGENGPEGAEPGGAGGLEGTGLPANRCTAGADTAAPAL
jgi:hypothetical protein